MNQERLDELVKRSQAAVEAAKLIGELKAADPKQLGVELKFRNANNGNSFLQPHVLNDVIERGRQSLILDKENELNRLLGIEPEEKGVILGPFYGPSNMELAR